MHSHRSNLPSILLRLAGLLAAASFVGCGNSQGLTGASCVTTADCPAGQACAKGGVCVSLLSGTSGSQTGSAGSSGSVTTSGNQGTSSSSGGWTAGNTSGNTSGNTAGNTSGNTAGSTAGSQSSSGGSGGWTSGGSSSGGANSGGSGSGSCACSSSCCSEQASASSTKSSGALTCPDGTVCWGSWYCSLAPSGGCTQADPCNGQSGVWSCGSGGSGSTTGSSSGAGSSSGSSAGSSSGGPQPVGSVGPNGGQISTLLFAVVGDTRPGMSGDPGQCVYPTHVINTIYQDIQALSPRPAFVVTTGDYMCCGSGCSGSSAGCSTPGADGNCATQAGLYVTAQKNFSGQVFSTMGNHECATSTSSNCGPSGTDGNTENYTAFLQNILGAEGITPSVYPTLANSEAYYVVKISSSPGVAPAWTAKFLMIAANAWDSGQQTWLQNELSSDSTTYTFIVRHEPSYTTNCGTGCDTSNTMLQSAGSAVTMMLTGHSHEYKQDTGASGGVELVIGNGGAPLSSGTFGYEVCGMSGANITCSQYDYQANAPTNPVTVNAQGVVQ